MKKIYLMKNLDKKAFWILSMVLILNLYPAIQSFGQAPKATDINGVQTAVQNSATSMIQMAKYIIGAVLFIALIGVVYMVASNHPKSKEAIIGWVVALVVYIIAVTIM